MFCFVLSLGKKGLINFSPFFLYVNLFLYICFKYKIYIMDRTISYEEHYIQVGFYQSIIKEKEKEVNTLRNKLKLSNDLLKKSKGIIETVKAKLEVSQQNRITI